jgi:hypothetical protein
VHGVAGQVPVEVKVTVAGGFCGFCGDQVKLAVGAAGVGGTATLHVREAGEVSVLPAASVARTSTLCEPLASPE